MERLQKLNRDVGAVAGSSGYGKTSLARRLASAEKYPRRLAIEAFPEKSEYGGEQIFDGEKLADAIAAAGRGGSFNISYYPQDADKEFPALCRLVWAARDVMFIVEEADRFFPDNVVPKDFRLLATAGRHRGISLLMVSQAPFYIPKVVRRECRFLAAFNLSEESDRKWVSEFPGGSKHDGGRKQLMDDVEGLAELEYYWFDRAKGSKAPERRRLEAAG